jgi:hypothetical protein
MLSSTTSLVPTADFFAPVDGDADVQHRPLAGFLTPGI